MKYRDITFQYILFCVLCCNSPSHLFLISADHGETSATVSSTIVPENISISSSSDKKDTPNIENPVDYGSDSILEPSVVENVVNENSEKQAESEDKEFGKQVFSEAVSQNSGVANDVIGNGPPVIVTLSDPATAELQQRADIPKLTSQPEETPQKPTQNVTEPIQTPETPSENTTSENRSASSEPTEKLDDLKPLAPQNLTDKTEEIPSFSEWAQKHLEEAEKKEQVNSSVQGQNSNGKQGSGAKLRWKNYASLDCGAKVIAANPESVSPGAVLSPSRDEYKLNACTSRIWFIVELCEAIQTKKIDLANYELFSSSPKDFTVSLSDRFPSREWSIVGQFTAKDEKDIQSFDLEPQIFGKYIKVEIKSHYGAEHFCPISLFRVYGTSVFEVLQKEDPAHVNPLEEDDDDDEPLDAENGDATKNLFSSATDAVISMVKKAAEVLGKKENSSNQTQEKLNNTLSFSPLVNSCSSPSHLVVCDNCTDPIFGLVYELLSCRSTQIRNLIGIPFISKALLHSDICQRFGFDLNPKQSNRSLNSCPECVKSFFSTSYLGAMCNSLAILENKVVLNISSINCGNVTQNVTSGDTLINIETAEPKVVKVETGLKEEILATDPLVLERTDGLVAKSSCSTDTPTSQINPTKVLTSDVNLVESTIVTTTSLPEASSVLPSEVLEEPSSEPLEKVAVEPEVPMENSLEDVVETTTESVETLDEHLDNIISELNGDTLPNPTSTTPPQVQKESVFLRLSNRIKALERNMSLSSQYLEELSKRYKKQVEEMQRLLEKTIVTLHEDSTKKDERNKQLEERLDSLTIAVETLLSERNSWTATLGWLFVTSFLLVGVLTFCARRRNRQPSAGATETPVEIHRRKSIDVVTHNHPPKKKRRPSDQALKIVRSATTSNETDKRMLGKDRRKKKKKPAIRRTQSINTLSEENGYSYSGSEGKAFTPKLTSSKIWNQEDWVEGSAHGIEIIPFALEESEHSTLEPLPMKVDMSSIDVPDFVQTAVDVRQKRVSTSQNGQPKELARESASLDENNSKKDAGGLTNGNSVSSSAEEQTPKKERRGFKKLFKKVF